MNNSDRVLTFTLEDSENHINHSDFTNSRLLEALPFGMAFGISHNKGILVAGTMAAVSQVVGESSNEYLKDHLFSKISLKPHAKQSAFILTKGLEKAPP